MKKGVVDMEHQEYEIPAEIDFTKMRVRRMGTGRKSFMGVPNPDYDPNHATPSYNQEVEKGMGDKFAPDPKSAPTVTLDPDVAAVFADDAAVNEALRYVIRLANENPLTASRGK